MSEFTLPNWKAALSKLYDRATHDEAYRQLCLSDPRTAVAQVSDIELPADFQFGFVTEKKDLFYSYALPPFLGGEGSEDVTEIIDWFARCTNPTTG